MFGFFFEKFLFIKGVGSKYTLFVFGNFFFAKSLLNKGRWVKGRHFHLYDTSFAFKGHGMCVWHFFAKSLAVQIVSLVIFFDKKIKTFLIAKRNIFAFKGGRFGQATRVHRGWRQEGARKWGNRGLR